MKPKFKLTIFKKKYLIVEHCCLFSCIFWQISR